MFFSLSATPLDLYPANTVQEFIHCA